MFEIDGGCGRRDIACVFTARRFRLFERFDTQDVPLKTLWQPDRDPHRLASNHIELPLHRPATNWGGIELVHKIAKIQDRGGSR